jgi:hypothetical protein
MQRLYFSLCLLGLAILTFIAGAVAMYYRVSPTSLIENALVAAESVEEIWRDRTSHSVSLPGEDDDAGVSYATFDKEVFGDEKYADGGDYTLITMRSSPAASLVDRHGKEIHRWRMPFRKAFPSPKHVNTKFNFRAYFAKAHVFPNGDLLAIYISIGDTPYGYGMVKIDKDSNVLWTYAQNAHHDFYVDPKTGEIWTILHQFLQRAPSGWEGLQYPALVDYIVRLSPDGKELERFSILDSFIDTPYALYLYHYSPKWDGKKWDWTHTNSIVALEDHLAPKFPMFKPGSLLVSFRNLNAIAVIDPLSKKIAWATAGLWQTQHSASFQESGNIMLFDNTGHYENGKEWSRVLEINPQTLGIAWSYVGNNENQFYSFVYGRAQGLPNGNVLVADSLTSRIFEVNRLGNKVWELRIFDKAAQAGNQKPEARNSIKPGSRTVIMSATRYAQDELEFLGK